MKSLTSGTLFVMSSTRVPDNRSALREALAGAQARYDHAAAPYEPDALALIRLGEALLFAEETLSSTKARFGHADAPYAPDILALISAVEAVLHVSPQTGRR
jgi:hypothetical protein